LHHNPPFSLSCSACPLDPQERPRQKETYSIKVNSVQKGELNMFITPVYQCRNCKKIYPGNKQEIPNAQADELVHAARYTLGSQDHVFRIGGKTIQLSDLHQCNANEIGLANFVKIQIGNEVRKE
jgi:hypothetical protein